MMTKIVIKSNLKTDYEIKVLGLTGHLTYLWYLLSEMLTTDDV